MPLESAEGMLVRYTAGELPTEWLVRLQHQTLAQFEADEIDLVTTFRIVNLLLNIALQKLDALSDA